MATWEANVWVSPETGDIKTTVEASTAQGAKQQIKEKHGNIAQIYNLRHISNGSVSSGRSSGGGDIAGTMILFGIVVAIVLIVNFWYIILPIVLISAIVWIWKWLGED